MVSLRVLRRSWYAFGGARGGFAMNIQDVSEEIKRWMRLTMSVE